MTGRKFTAAQVITIICTFVAIYMATSMGPAVSLALPLMTKSLQLDTLQAQWILAGFLLSRVAMLRSAGALCDWLGARKMFLFGMYLLSATSLACALARNEEVLIFFRVLQGVSGAMLSTSSLLLLRSSMPPDELAQATSIWSFAGIAGFGLAPVIGGLIVNTWHWPALFYVSAAGMLVCALVFAKSKVGIPNAATPRAPRPAIRKELLISSALLVLAYLIGQGDLKDALVFLACAFVVILMVERRAMMRASVWKADVPRLLIVLAGLSGFAAIAAVVLWSAYFVQMDLDRSVLAYGLDCLPMAVTGTISCLVAKRLIDSKRIDACFLYGGMAVLLMTGCTFLAEFHHSEPYTIAALAFTGLCYGFLNAPITAAMLETFPVSQSGNASSIATLSKQFGQLVGIAIVAAWKNLSTSAPIGDMTGFFLLVGGCGVVLLACSMLRAAGRRRDVVTGNP